MEAKILRIMESWPLQLALETAAGVEEFMLADGATIWRSGILVDPGELRPDQYVRMLLWTPQGKIAELEILD